MEMHGAFTVHCKFIIRAPSLCRGRIQRKTWSMGPNAGVDYDLTLCPLKSRLQHITLGIGQPYARVDLNPRYARSRLYPPVRDFRFGLSTVCTVQFHAVYTVHTVLLVPEVSTRDVEDPQVGEVAKSVQLYVWLQTPSKVLI